MTVRRAKLENLRSVGTVDDIFCQAPERSQRKSILCGTGIRKADLNFRTRRSNALQRWKQAFPIGPFGGLRSRDVSDKAASADVSFQEARLFENRVSSRHGGPIQAKVASQFASGWQLFTGLDGAGINH